MRVLKAIIFIVLGFILVIAGGKFIYAVSLQSWARGVVLLLGYYFAFEFIFKSSAGGLIEGLYVMNIPLLRQIMGGVCLAIHFFWFFDFFKLVLKLCNINKLIGCLALLLFIVLANYCYLLWSSLWPMAVGG